VSGVSPDTATMACQVCGTQFTRSGRRRHCSTICRQAAWRRRNAAPAMPLVKKPDTVYECPSCEARLLGEQRCPDCKVFARRLGPGGACPCCDEAIAVTELIGTEHFIVKPPANTTGGGDRQSPEQGGRRDPIHRS
jgi:hypothetical protein